MKKLTIVLLAVVLTATTFYMLGQRHTRASIAQEYRIHNLAPDNDFREGMIYYVGGPDEASFSVYTYRGDSLIFLMDYHRFGGVTTR